jgi:hypothetical protein
MHKAMEKTSKINNKKGSFDKQTTTHPHLAPHKVSSASNANQKANKDDAKKKMLM